MVKQVVLAMVSLLLVAPRFASAADAAVAAATEAPVDGPLAKYVAKADESYKWTKRREGEYGEAKFVELIMTSQTWKDVVWRHQLFILKPKSCPENAKNAVLFITGGRWDDKLLAAPGKDDKFPKETPIFVALAEQLKSPVAILLQVPQQPILGGRFEDDAIAETFVNYMKTGDEEWPLLLPMVKSAVRAMDTTQEFTRKEWKLGVKEFTVTGASKRGWTTWLTGAADARATAIAPMVIDVLNMSEQMKLQVDSFGAPSEQIQDYIRRGLHKHLTSEKGMALNRIVDPYSYRKRLTQPKLILLGTNDRYWPLDAAKLYWDALEGEKHLLYIPNNPHGLNDVVRISGALAALHRRAMDGTALPKLAWKPSETDGGLTIDVTSDVAPKSVRAWVATAATRDFRDSKWTSRPAEKNGEGFKCQLELPKDGYAAMFGEAQYENGGPTLFLSTNVRIIGGNGEAKTGGGK